MLRRSPGEVLFEWESLPGFDDQVQYTTDMKSWSNTLPGSTFMLTPLTAMNLRP